MFHARAGLYVLLGVFFCHFCCSLSAQAPFPALTDTSYKIWSWLSPDYQLSGDGKYVSYDVHGYDRANYYGLLVTTKGNVLMRTGSRERSQFTADSRYLVSWVRPDSILVYDLGRRRNLLSLRGSGFQMLQVEKVNWLSYRRGDSVIVESLGHGRQLVYAGVREFLPAAGGTALVLKRDSAIDWLDLRTQQARTIFNGPSRFLTLSSDGQCLAFMQPAKDSCIIYHYTPGPLPAQRVAWSQMPGLDPEYRIDETDLGFSPNGQQLYFQLRKSPVRPEKDPALLTEEVEVWHYQQPFLYSSQRWNNPANRRYQAVVGIGQPGSRPVVLENDSMALSGIPGNDYVLVSSNNVRTQEDYFNERQAALYELVSVRDGSRRTFRPRSSRYWYAALSPAEKFITWVSKDDHDIYTYEIATGITRNVSAGMHLTPDIVLQTSGSPALKFEFISAGWLPGDTRFLHCDRYDCWLIDPLSEQPPVNLTNGYGRRYRISFRPAFANQAEVLPGGELLLRARDERTGDNGFWQTKAGSDPIKKVMEPCLYSWHKMNEPPRIRKAAHASVYLVTRQTAATSMNLLVTEDLQHFRPLSQLQPEKGFNWMRSELLRYRMANGDTNQAILYKPDNFDPSRRYPVLFHYYQERNVELHDYRRPVVESNLIDIPWYVSNGYLVCIPDIINNKPGRISQTVVQSVEGAARYLGQFPWVDMSKLGAQGHSFGGYETLLLVAHSRLFAAAQPSAAVSDLVSMIGGTAFGDQELYTWHETSQANMGIGNLPWSDPQSYIDNSPVFHADKVSTPVLLMHGREDENVKFNQDIEMFTALRRLGKPVWILGYKEGHVIPDYDPMGSDAALRQRQFFEHYLKGKPAPVWMTKGVTPQDRRFQSGLQLDSTNIRP